MKFKNLDKKKIFIVGLGISGLSLAIKLKKENIDYYCWDDRERIRISCLKKKLNLISPDKVDFHKIDLLVLSPGISNDHKTVSLAKKYQCEIISDIELIKFISNEVFLIGITGTNGKSTTTKLVEYALKENKKNSFSAGNIGIPISKLKLKQHILTYLIVEASSFQLERIIELKFNISVLLNISNDHIDRHKNIGNYIAAKSNIFKNQSGNDFSIICIDDSKTKKLAQNFSKNFNSKLITISSKNSNNCDFFIELKNDMVVITDKKKNTIFRFNKNYCILKGKHNLPNILACFVICELLQIKKQVFLENLKKFKGLEHRFEYFKKYKNIEFYNDSKSTNVESSKVALESLDNIFWIVGGRKKPGGLEGIHNSLGKVLKAFIFGESKKDFNQYLSNYLDTETFETLDTAVEKAISIALEKKLTINILLSPASASFDQFKNFEQRGVYFKKIVKKIVSI